MTGIFTPHIKSTGAFGAKLTKQCYLCVGFILDVLFPVYCLNCRNELGINSGYICNKCLENFPVTQGFNCPICSSRMPEGKICKECRKKTSLRRLFYAAKYENQTIRDYIHQFKYQGVKIFSRQLAGLIIKTFKEEGIDRDVKQNRNNFLIIPAPLHNKKLHERGFNQSDEIAKYVAQELQVICLPDALQRIKETEPQAEIKDTKKREENVKNCFKRNNAREVKNKIVILVDDVYTTGATMEECARVLKESGAKEVWGVVVAKG